MRYAGLGFVVIALFGGSSAGRAAEPVGARAFVASIYAGYGSANRPSPSVERFFTPEMQRLFARDRKQARGGEPYYLGSDPICQCQDDIGLKADIVSVEGGEARASIAVLTRYTPPLASGSNKIVLHLRKVGSDWRIDDIETKLMPSFHRWLERALDETR